MKCNYILILSILVRCVMSKRFIIEIVIKIIRKNLHYTYQHLNNLLSLNENTYNI